MCKYKSSKYIKLMSEVMKKNGFFLELSLTQNKTVEKFVHGRKGYPIGCVYSPNKESRIIKVLGSDREIFENKNILYSFAMFEGRHLAKCEKNDVPYPIYLSGGGLYLLRGMEEKKLQSLIASLVDNMEVYKEIEIDDDFLGVDNNVDYKLVKFCIVMTVDRGAIFYLVTDDGKVIIPKRVLDILKDRATLDILKIMEPPTTYDWVHNTDYFKDMMETIRINSYENKDCGIEEESIKILQALEDVGCHIMYDDDNINVISYIEDAGNYQQYHIEINDGKPCVNYKNYEGDADDTPLEQAKEKYKESSEMLIDFISESLITQKEPTVIKEIPKKVKGIMKWLRLK